MVLAISGGGKSSSTRNLNPKTTGYINCDRKEPPLLGWEANYKQVLTPDGLAVDFTKSNLVEPSRAGTVKNAFIEWEKRKDIDTIILDTITHMITADYVDNAIGKDWNEYQKMGKTFFEIVDLVRDSKKDVVVFAHLAEDFNDMGSKVFKMKSPGKMIEGFDPPSFFTTVLYGYTERKENKTRGHFRTQKLTDAEPYKSPAYFVDDEAVAALDYIMPNDIKLVLDKLRDFRAGTVKKGA